jgi:hypothetical protein
MTVSVNGTTGITFNDASTQNTAATGFGFKNRIINGAMMIDQRNAGASVSTNSSFVTDRWKIIFGGGGVLSAQQSTTAPEGFTNSLYITATTADSSITSTDEYSFRQTIEGYNVSDLGWGTVNAKSVTLSFKARSSVTGTFSGVVRNNASNRVYVFTYTINSANTWETQAITIPGDTTGTWLTNNSIGLHIIWSLGAGSSRVSTAGVWGTDGAIQGATGQVNWIATSGATFYITGVQLEKGSTATSFDYRPYGTELALCQRYYHQITGGTNSFAAVGSGAVASGTNASIYTTLPVTMRANPTMSYTGSITVDAGPSNVGTFSSITTSYGGAASIWFNVNTTGNTLTVGRAAIVYCGNATTNFVTFSAEL